jgi:ABC-type phosphonate transport system ATPase subunit
LDVWEIVTVTKDNRGSVADTAAYLEVDPRLVQSALRYYGAYRDEIDGWIERVHALNEREESTWRAAQEAISA